MIYTVTFNPSLDYVIQVDDLTLGRVNRTTKEAIFPGGKGVNVSVILSNLGIKSKALGFIAGFTGKHGQGPNIGDRAITELFEKLDCLQNGDILVLAGSIPNTLPEDIYESIMERLQTKGVRIVVDATKDLLLNVLKYHPFLIKPNNHELGEMFGVTLKTDEEIITYAKKLQEKGARNVLISMAGDGAILITEDGEIHKGLPPKGEVVNSVGAGDSMVAGFLTGYLNTGDYEKAFKLGIATGSATAFLAWLAEKEDVVKLLDEAKENFGL